MIIKINNIRVRAVVDCQGMDLAGPFRETLGKLQYIADGSPTKTVQALVVVAYNAKIAVFASQQEQKALLHGVGILIFVNEDVAEAFSQFCQHSVRVGFQKAHRFKLHHRKIQQVFFFEQAKVAGIPLAQRLHGFVCIVFQGSGVDALFRKLVELMRGRVPLWSSPLFYAKGWK